MEHPRKRPRTTSAAVLQIWDKYWRVVELKAHAHVVMEKAAHVHSALTHKAWPHVNGVCRTLLTLDEQLAGVVHWAQTHTLAEMRMSQHPATARGLILDYEQARADLVFSKAEIPDLVEGIAMRHQYPVINETEEQLMSCYHELERFAQRTDVLGRFSVLHTGICRAGAGMVGELSTRLHAVGDDLDLELRSWRTLDWAQWKFKAILRGKMSDLDSRIDSSACAVAELVQIRDFITGCGPQKTLPVSLQRRCYICLDDFSCGLTPCDTCEGTVCESCTPSLVANACDSGLGASNGEAPLHHNKRA